MNGIRTQSIKTNLWSISLEYPSKRPVYKYLLMEYRWRALGRPNFLVLDPDNDRVLGEARYEEDAKRKAKELLLLRKKGGRKRSMGRQDEILKGIKDYYKKNYFNFKNVNSYKGITGLLKQIKFNENSPWNLRCTLTDTVHALEFSNHSDRRIRINFLDTFVLQGDVEKIVDPNLEQFDTIVQRVNFFLHDEPWPSSPECVRLLKDNLGEIQLSLSDYDGNPKGRDRRILKKMSKLVREAWRISKEL